MEAEKRPLKCQGKSEKEQHRSIKGVINGYRQREEAKRN